MEKIFDAYFIEKKEKIFHKSINASNKFDL